MKKIRLFCNTVVSLGLMGLLAGCSSTSAPAGTSAAAQAETSTAVSNETEAGAETSDGGASSENDGYVYEPIEKRDYTWGTSGTSGTNYIVGAGIADVVNKQASSANFLVQSTAGATENLTLMLNGEMDFGYMSANSIYNGYHKTDYMADRVPEPYLYNVVITTHGSSGHMLARVDSGINSYFDLKGKTICTGTTSVEGHTICEALISTYGIDVESDMTKVWLSQDEAMTRLQDGEIDAVYLNAGYPIAAFTNAIVASPGTYTLISPDIENLEQVKEQFPYLSITEIPAGTYPGIDFSVNALRTAISVVTPVETPAAVTYELAKYAYENWSEIQNVHAALLETEPEDLAKADIPLHPGAQAYFQSIGLVD